MLLGRQKDLKRIKAFINGSDSGLVHIRGRRRVGKSAILLHLRDKLKNCFYFSGTKDSTNEQLLSDFAEQFDFFVNQARLTKLKSEHLT